MRKNPPAALSVERKNLRLLKGDEKVRHGDFVADGGSDFTLWEGPGGFRADSFVTCIYRWRQPLPAEEINNEDFKTHRSDPV